MSPDYHHETILARCHGDPIVGLDEAGRGPWAGPVTAAAAWLDPEILPKELLSKINDSKKLSEKARCGIADELMALPKEAFSFGLGWSSPREIDDLNILAASLLAMERAVAALPISPAAALVDGRHLPKGLPCPGEAMIKGDSRSLSIAAASILAKVARDRHLAELAKRFPGYGWERNKGYGTAEHQAGLLRLGVNDEHRKSFRPIRESLGLTS